MMLTLSPVWHGRLRAARGLTNLLMQTLVSVISNLAMWHLRRRAKGEHA
ncbi:hypothetical protein [Pantoea dispersa]|nr:hypothetical protein [Pantoea dispersa]MBS0900059.1 hypothetical protein [Pantoea dispersa]